MLHQNPQFLEDVKGLSDYLKSELNVKSVRFSSELAKNIKLTCEPDYRSLGMKFSTKDGPKVFQTVKNMKTLRKALESLVYVFIPPPLSSSNRAWENMMKVLRFRL